MLLQTRSVLLLRSLWKTQQALSGGSSSCGNKSRRQPPEPLYHPPAAGLRTDIPASPFWLPWLFSSSSRSWRKRDSPSLRWAELSCPAAAGAAATIAAGGAAAAAEPCPARAVPLAGRKPHPSPAAWQVSLYRWTLIAFLVAEASRERA